MMIELTIAFVLYITCLLVINWFLNKPPEIITREIMISKYHDFQDYHKNKFKEEINNGLKVYCKAGMYFPLTFTYQKVLDECSLNFLRDYIRYVLKFENFELENEENICRLTLKE
jgi:hypothetical protein